MSRSSRLLQLVTTTADPDETSAPGRPRPVPGGLHEQGAGALCLDGLLAAEIEQGGAHASFEGSAAQAKDLAVVAVDALFGRRYEDVRVDVTDRAWTPWFCDVAWDSTYVLTDRASAEITVVRITDTDTD